MVIKVCVSPSVHYLYSLFPLFFKCRLIHMLFVQKTACKDTGCD